jgi:hypothetical protein
VTPLLARARRLLDAGLAIRAPSLEDDAALRREAERLRPVLEALVGVPYGRLPRIGYRRGIEARLAGPWSQYLTLGLGPTRIVRMTSQPASRGAIPTILAHELAHRYTFDESVTTLRGLEVSARVAEGGDALHARALRLELARLALGAAMAVALRTADGAAVDDFFAGADAGEPALARPRAHWATVRLRLGRDRRPDVVTTVYAELPGAALARAEADGASESAPIPFPRFPVDSAQAFFTTATTAADALTGRRRARVALASTLRVWREHE